MQIARPLFKYGRLVPNLVGSSLIELPDGASAAVWRSRRHVDNHRNSEVRMRLETENGDRNQNEEHRQCRNHLCKYHTEQRIYVLPVKSDDIFT